MAKSKSFLQEAVVAAKEVREAAIQHAYKELEENLTPSIKEALAQKLEEDLEIEDLEESNGAVAGFKPVKEPKKEIKEEDEKPEEEEETEETEETEEEETIEEPEEDTEVPEESEDDDESHEEAESDEKEAEEHDEPSDDTELKDLTLGDLKELIASMVSAIAPEKPAEQPEDMVPADVQGQGDEDTPITPSDEEELDIDMTADKVEGDAEEKETEEDDEINLDELLKELESEEHDRKVVTHKEDAEFQKELDEVRKERDEALTTIEEMKETLKNVNLLNAKLSCTVRLLSKPLTEGQRVRTIKSLDEAQSAKEVKAIYRTLVESFTSEAKAKKGGLIKEHRGSASRAAGKSTAAPIVEVDPMVRRFQQLAGIID